MGIVVDPKTRPWLRAAVISGGALLLLQIIRWPLTSIITPFLEPVVELAAGVCVLVVLVGSFIHAIRHHRQARGTGWLPFGVCVLTAGLIYIVPFNLIYMDGNFYLLRHWRAAVARSIVSGPEGHKENSGGRGDFISLPPHQSILSSGGGDIVIDHRDGRVFVLFFTYRGILDSFSGYVYSPDDTPPAKDQFLGDGVEIWRVSPHWFWYAS
jgi:hypothetical protein